jgi:hypothetical protein
MPPTPVVVVGLRDGMYACDAKRQGAWALRVDPRTAGLPGPVADGYLAHELVAARALLHLVSPRHAEAEAVTVVRCQIAQASSANATASRRFTGASAASS